MRDSVIRAEKLSVGFGGSSILGPLSFEVSDGEMVALVGANGSGKSTLLGTICGDRHSISGTCKLSGIGANVRGVLRKSITATLLAQMPVSPDFTVEEHLQLLEVSWKENPDAAVDDSVDVINEFFLGKSRKAYPHELSSGQRQCLALAMTLGRSANNILLDEPERHLDEFVQTKIIKALTRRRDQRTAILYATHSRQFIDAADTVININEYRLDDTNAVI